MCADAIAQTPFTASPPAVRNRSRSPHVVTKPDWLTKPTPEEMGRFYPPFAQLLNMEGRVDLICQVNVKGTLEACRTEGELPLGLGFGKAALRVAPIFKMRPMLTDGRPVVGGTVRIPLQFTLPEPEVVQAWPPSDRDPQELAAARQLVAARVGANASFTLPAIRQGIYQRFKLTPAPADAAERDQAVDRAIAAYAEAFKRGFDEIAARKQSLADLRTDVAFAQGSASKAWAEARDANAKLQDQWWREAIMRASSGSMATFCAKISCPQQPESMAPLEPADVDPATLAMARRLLAGRVSEASAKRLMDQTIARLNLSPLGPESPEAREAYIAAMKTAVKSAYDEVQEMSARSYARQMSLKDLTEVALFNEDLGRRTYPPESAEVSKLRQEMIEITLAEASKAGHDAFCKATTCVTHSPPAKP